MGGSVGDLVGGVTDVVETVTPWNDDSSIGQIATGLAIGAATGGIAASYGAGLITSVSAGGLAAAGFSQAQVAQERLEDQSGIDLQREQLLRAQEEDRRRRAASRRAILATLMLQGTISYNPLDTTAEKREYKNTIPSLGNTIDMSGG